MVVDDDALDPAKDDPFEIVGVPRTATRQEIRRAYRRKARFIHPDVVAPDIPDAAAKFRRLTVAFQMLMDTTRTADFETQRKRSNARSRAQRQWDDLYDSATAGSRSRAYSTRSERPAGSRAEAEAKTRAESEKRRRRWREMSFEEIFREHMPLEYEPLRSPFQRVDFVAAMEVAVQAFVREKTASRGNGSAGASSGGGAESSGRKSYATADDNPEAAETEELIKLTNREVLRSELSDARHRSAKHRDRVRWLEAELQSASNKAAMWRGATPSTESDRVQSLERELAFLELANRFRERLGEQRVALQRLKAREKAITERLATMPGDGR